MYLNLCVKAFRLRELFTSKSILVMKLTIIILTLACMQVSATGYAQQITLSENNTALSRVFSLIEKQSGYNFFYKRNSIKDAKVSIQLEDASIDQALSQILLNKPLSYSIVDNTVVIKVKKNYLEKTGKTDLLTIITGKIVDHNGNPLSGVTIKLKEERTIGTVTDMNGNYSVKLPDNTGTLLFSSLGFITQEVKINGQSVINVQLREEKQALNEVVVVGYGTRKKANLTGAVSVIDSKRIEDRPVTNVLGALQGAASGVTVTRSSGQPGAEGYNMQIRGLSSANGSKPLYIVDGAAGSIATLNPNDIATISILKDAAVSAIYGARAAGGVVLITTKSGKSGKTNIQYTGMYGVQKLGRMPERLHSYEEAELQNIAWVNAGLAPAWSDEQIGWLKDPNFNYRVSSPTTPDVYEYYDDVNAIDELVKISTPSQQHNISVSGGNETSRYLISLGYFDQKGMFKVNYDNTNRINARLNYNTKFSSKFSADLRLSYVKTATQTPVKSVGGRDGILYNMYKIRSQYPMYVPETNNTKYVPGNDVYGYLKDGGQSDSTSHFLSPVLLLKADKLVKGLSLRTIYAPTLIINHQESITRSFDRWNRFTLYNTLNKPNAYSDDNTLQVQNNIQLLADYDFNIKKANNFHVLLGYSFEDYNYRRTIANARGLSSNDLFTLGLGDPLLTTNVQNIQTWALMSYFGNVNYNLNDKYLVDVSTRYDGSSKLAPGNRWHLFPSISAAWRINNEDWFKNNISFFDELKIRASWGQLGNSEGVIGNYDYLALLNTSSNYSFNNQVNKTFYQKNLASPDKTWETVETSNIGLDAQILKGRLGFSGDYYIKRNRDMLAPLTVSSTIGATPSNSNVADLKTWGWELSVNWKDKIGSKFNYYVNANLSDDKNKILSYVGQSIISTGLNRIIEGMPYNSLYGYQADGYFQNAAELQGAPFQNSKTGVGDIRYVNQNPDVDNVISVGLGRVDNHGDLIYMGSTQPRYSFGFDLGFDFKGIDFTAFFQGVGKRNALLDAYATLPYLESWRTPWKDNLDYWTPENRDARYPRMVYAGTQNAENSTHWLANSAYLRLKNVQVGYTLPSSVAAKMKANKIRVYFSGQDLWETTKMWNPYYDPEAPSGANFLYPFFQNYTLGLNVNF